MFKDLMYEPAKTAARPHDDLLTELPKKTAANRPSYTSEQLHQVFEYDPDEGLLTWRQSPSMSVKVGDEAGSVMRNKVTGACTVQVGILGWRYPVAQIIWTMYYGKAPETRVQFVDDDPTNLRIDNLTIKAKQYDPASREGSEAARQAYAAAQLRKVNKEALKRIMANEALSKRYMEGDDRDRRILMESTRAKLRREQPLLYPSRHLKPRGRRVKFT